LYTQFKSSNFKLYINKNSINSFIEEVFYVTYNILPIRFPEQFNNSRFNQLFAEQETNIKNKLNNMNYLELYLPVKINDNNIFTIQLSKSIIINKVRDRLNVLLNNFGPTLKSFILVTVDIIYKLAQKIEITFPNLKIISFVSTFYFVLLRLIAALILFFISNQQFMVVRELKIVVFSYLILIAVINFMPTRFISPLLLIIKYFLFPFCNPNHQNGYFINRIQKYWFYIWSSITYTIKQILEFHFFISIFIIIAIAYLKLQSLFILFYFFIFLKTCSSFLSILFDQMVR
jgi:hypothetical protein